jgi:hypothetical protein
MAGTVCARGNQIVTVVPSPTALLIAIVAATGRSDQADPRDRVEGAGTTVPAVSRAGKSPTVVVAAIARELAGFVWAIARQAQPTGA